MKVTEEEPRVRVLSGAWDTRAVIREVVAGGQEDPFYVLDVGVVVRRYRDWLTLMPRVEPFYAVKCNNDKTLLSTLAALGAGFDCASKGEIDSVLQLGVRPERIIFANPAKMASHIQYSDAAGVDTMTFDNETELYKIKRIMPHAKLVIRIRCDATAAQCPLGIKFGCDPVTEAPRLIKLAAVLGLNVVGVSFHVGSGAGESSVYSRAIQYARALFDTAVRLGMPPLTLLDLGGGFPGHHDSDVVEASVVINSALDKYFSDGTVKVIAEPGRYFAAEAYTLAAMVHSKRELPPSLEGEPHTMYFINDGVYGSFNCVLYDHQAVHPEPLEDTSEKSQPCSVWGPSCDGLDVVCPAVSLPPLRAGDWLVFADMGAYTLPVASPFNGFPVPGVIPVVSVALWEMLRDLLPLTEHHFVVDSPPAPLLPPLQLDQPARLIELTLH